jgi:hypothetical protein
MPNIEPEKVVRVRRGNSGRYLFPNIRKAASAVRARRVHGSGDLVGCRSMPVYDNAMFLELSERTPDDELDGARDPGDYFFMTGAAPVPVAVTTVRLSFLTPTSLFFAERGLP